MPIALLIPNSTTDASGTISSGNHTNIDEGTSPNDAGDTSYVTTVANGSNGDFTFGLSDLPGNASSINSATLYASANIIGTYDNDTNVWAISATNDTASVSWDASVAGDRTESIKSAALTGETVGSLNAETITVSQTSWNQSMAPDGLQFQIEWIYIEVDYVEATAIPKTTLLTTLGVG